MCLLCTLPFAQTTAQTLGVEAGKGIKQLKLGTSKDKLLKILGTPQDIGSFRSEWSAYESDGYDAEEELVFLIGFDEVLTYYDNNKYGVWKIYLRKDRIIFLNFSSYIHGRKTMDRLRIGGKLKFGDQSYMITKKLGGNYIMREDATGNGEYFYLEKGICILTNGSVIKNVFIFPPQKAKKLLELKEQLKEYDTGGYRT